MQEQLYKFTSCFKANRGEQRAFLISASSQLTSAQNNPCAKVVYFEIVFSATLQQEVGRITQVPMSSYSRKTHFVCFSASVARETYVFIHTRVIGQVLTVCVEHFSRSWIHALRIDYTTINLLRE